MVPVSHSSPTPLCIIPGVTSLAFPSQCFLDINFHLSLAGSRPALYHLHSLHPW
ncbi:hypothetical protein HanIR_Chr14g0724051 [Helianthus annuus]|nr:hypothetical protein HanIR_Chr14g0724051 [Helianthus annuus]